MSVKSSSNVAASIRQRLLNRARSDHRPFGELLQYFAMERFLYRLSRSRHAKRFVLKGALMLRAWNSPEFRPTMDIDVLGKTPNEDANLVAKIKDIIGVEVPPDGLVFDPDSIRTERITQETEYQGIRLRFKAVLDSARVTIQIDVGFGDVVFPEPQPCTLPSLLDFPSPRLMGYSRESAIAEKFEAMVRHRELNSRMKDFYDVWLLSRQFEFDGNQLGEAIRRTFDKRGVPLPEAIVAFTESFISVKQVAWTAFRKRLEQESIPKSFADVVGVVDGFLSPLVTASIANRPPPARWHAPGPWRG
jgi:predicted nucleotidyltransferase component of viral defense system